MSRRWLEVGTFLLVLSLLTGCVFLPEEVVVSSVMPSQTATATNSSMSTSTATATTTATLLPTPTPTVTPTLTATPIPLVEGAPEGAVALAPGVTYYHEILTPENIAQVNPFLASLLQYQYQHIHYIYWDMSQ